MTSKACDYCGKQYVPSTYRPELACGVCISAFRCTYCGGDGEREVHTSHTFWIDCNGCNGTGVTATKQKRIEVTSRDDYKHFLNAIEIDEREIKKRESNIVYLKAKLLELEEKYEWLRKEKEEKEPPHRQASRFTIDE